MKQKIFISLVAVLMLFGCPQEHKSESNTQPSTEKVKVNKVKDPMTKYEYAQGESLDLSGLSIRAEINGETQTIYYSQDPASFTIADITDLTPGTYDDIICQYKKADFKLNSITIFESRTQKNSWETSEIPSDFALNNDFWDNANVYFVITDRFYNGNTGNDTSYGREKGSPANGNSDCAKFFGGDIAGLTAKLDYLEQTGINAIWITAPYEQIHGWIMGAGGTFKHYPYHGYYAMDYTNIDANMGTLDEFRTFIDAAHAKGIRVIMDVVMNHPGYNTLEDGLHLYPDVLKKTDIENAPIDFHSAYVNYSAHGWDDWWGGDWVRAGLCSHYTTGTGTIHGSQSGLPDFRTGSPKSVSIPTFLQKKYTADVAAYYPSEGYSLSTPTTTANYRVRDYLIKWLSDWVREFGIDGFRCDTAKHVEKEAWYQLKVACVQALRDWKDANPSKVIPDSGDFWMTGEVNPHAVSKDSYFSEGGFDSLLNIKGFLTAAGSAVKDIKTIEPTYADYASKINTDDQFNMLSFISFHDTDSLFYNYYAKTADKQKIAGSLLAFCPGAIQIYYGDECGRKDSSITVADDDQKTRSQMPWDEDGYRSAQLGYDFDADIHAHWSKVLNFRKNHVAVGAGAHAKIKDAPYTFSRVKGDDKVIIVLGASGSVEVDVSAIGATKVKDAYTGNVVDVADGKVTFTADSNGVILIEVAE